MTHDDDQREPVTDAPARWEVADPPPGPEPVAASTVVAGTVGAIGLVVLDGISGGLVTLLAGVPGGSSEGAPFVPPTSIPGTAAPAVRAGGLVPCTRCGTAVAFATMALNEHGYFCSACGPSQPA